MRLKRYHWLISCNITSLNNILNVESCNKCLFFMIVLRLQAAVWVMIFNQIADKYPSQMYLYDKRYLATQTYSTSSAIISPENVSVAISTIIKSLDLVMYVFIHVCPEWIPKLLARLDWMDGHLFHFFLKWFSKKEMAKTEKGSVLELL